MVESNMEKKNTLNKQWAGTASGYTMNPNNFKMTTAKSYQDSVVERATKNQKYMTKLYKVSGVSIFFIIAQLIGGYISGSIAIFADTAHLASDMMGFVIAMAGIKLGERKADAHMSYGYHRAELVGTLVSVISIWIMTIWLLVAATERLFMPPQVQGNLMFIVAVIGLFFNMIQIKILHGGDEHFHLGEEIHGEGGGCHGHAHGGGAHKEDEEDHHGHATTEKDHGNAHAIASEPRNLNMDAATLHVLGDLLSSVGVIIASIFIYLWPSLWIMDPICTYIFAIFVSYTTLPTVRKLLDLMMEATPDVIAVEKDGDKDKNLGIKELSADILAACDAICEYHDLHVWKLGGGKMSMTCHITSHKPAQTL